jgi:hypothetical protein
LGHVFSPSLAKSDLFTSSELWRFMLTVLDVTITDVFLGRLMRLELRPFLKVPCVCTHRPCVQLLSAKRDGTQGRICSAQSMDATCVKCVPGRNTCGVLSFWLSFGTCARTG